MTASQASNETRLPPAVRRIVTQTQGKIDARQASKTESVPPAAQTPPAVPPTETPPAPPAAPVAAPPVASRENDAAYWKQRFDTTDGILRAQSQQNATMVQDLRNQIAALQSKVSELTAKQPPSPIELSQFFTPEQIAKYGEEQCREMARTAQAAAHAEVQRVVDTQLKPLQEARVKDKADEAARRDKEFRDQVTQLVPDWEHIEKTDPGWFHWLTQLDTSTDTERQQILTYHVRRGNAPAVARMFNAYKASLLPPAPPAPPPVPEPPVTAQGTGAVDSVPPVAAPAAQGGAPSDAEVREFFKRSALGKVTDQDRVAFEARLKLRSGR